MSLTISSLVGQLAIEALLHFLILLIQTLRTALKLSPGVDFKNDWKLINIQIGSRLYRFHKIGPKPIS